MPDWICTAHGRYELNLRSCTVFLRRTEYPNDEPRWLATCHAAGIANLLLEALEIGPAKLEALRFILAKLRRHAVDVEGAMP